MASNDSDIDVEVQDEVDKLHEEEAHRVDNSKVVMKFLEKLLSLEEEYASQVKQLCRAQPSVGLSGTSGCFSVLVGVICEQASNTLSNLATLTIDAISPLKSALLHVKTEMTETYVEGKKLQVERRKVFENYKKVKHIYETLLEESPMEKTTLVAETEYRHSVTTFNNQQSTYFQEQLPKIVKQFQSAELIRASKTYDALQKYIMFLSDKSVKFAEAVKVNMEKANKSTLTANTDIEKFKKICDKVSQPPQEIQFGQDVEVDKSDPGSPCVSLRSKFIKHGKTASAKWRNSLSSLTANRDSKKATQLKRQSLPSKPPAGLFGASLHILMENQKLTYPKLDVPFVAHYLINHFKKIGGLQTENIFRVPGMTVEVQNVRAALEAGEFTEDLQFCSVHSTASVLTMWLRQLPSPLIPFYMHSNCLGPKSQEELLRIFYGLPGAHLNLLVYLISFIQELAKPENQEKTHMDADNLAMVFTPAILRSQNPSDVLTNIEKERQFVKSAIDAADLLAETFTIRLNAQPTSPTLSSHRI